MNLTEKEYDDLYHARNTIDRLIDKVDNKTDKDTLKNAVTVILKVMDESKEVEI